MDKIEVLAAYYPVDQLLEDNDINPLVVYNYLYREGMIDIEQYFPEETFEDDN